MRIETENLREARSARDEALRKVERKRWRRQALRAIEYLPYDFEGTGERIRLTLLRKGLEPPHHHNAWGALIRTAVLRGLLIDTGRMTNMRTKKSHARLTVIYVRDDADD